MADLQDLIRQLEQTFDWDKQLNETEMFNVWKVGRNFEQEEEI